MEIELFEIENNKIEIELNSFTNWIFELFAIENKRKK